MHGALRQPRAGLVAALDADHRRAIFVGGGSFTTDMVTPEGVFAAPDMLAGRNDHAVAFAAGKFIVSGGWATHAGGTMLDHVETLPSDPSKWPPLVVWQSAGNMPGGARINHTMTTLSDGRRVLIAGGGGRDAPTVTIFDTSTGTWSVGPPLNVGRSAHRAVRLADGRVLIAGGYQPATTPPTSQGVQSSTEIYDPATGRWAMAAPMNQGRFAFEMVLLPDGRVVVAGGSNNSRDQSLGALRSAEIYDPKTDAWIPLPPMRDARVSLAMAVLSNGIYVAGGAYGTAGEPLPDVARPGPIIQTVLASAERLSWDDLAAALALAPDGGLLDRTAGDGGDEAPQPDGFSGCTSDAGAPMGSVPEPPRDIDDGATAADGATGEDAAPPIDARTSSTGGIGGGTTDRDANDGTSEGKGAVGASDAGGCACRADGSSESRGSSVALAWLVAICLRAGRRRKNPSGEATSPS